MSTNVPSTASEASLRLTIQGLTEQHTSAVIEVYTSSGDTFVRIEKEALVDVCRWLRDEHHFVYLADIVGTDRFTADERFEVIYNLLNLKNQSRLFLKIRCEEDDPSIESVTGVWPGANWKEREVYDMFGIRFDHHPDLRRMYLPEDFAYYPLRKEFPLLGVPGSIPLPNTTPDAD